MGRKLSNLCRKCQVLFQIRRDQHNFLLCELAVKPPSLSDYPEVLQRKPSRLKRRRRLSDSAKRSRMAQDRVLQARGSAPGCSWEGFQVSGPRFAWESSLRLRKPPTHSWGSLSARKTLNPERRSLKLTKPIDPQQSYTLKIRLTPNPMCFNP